MHGFIMQHADAVDLQYLGREKNIVDIPHAIGHHHFPHLILILSQFVKKCTFYCRFVIDIHSEKIREYNEDYLGDLDLLTKHKI